MTTTDTTISVSKKFHDWLKSKGMKGESYEEIIKGLLKPEAAKELQNHAEPTFPKDTSEQVDVDYLV